MYQMLYLLHACRKEVSEIILNMEKMEMDGVLAILVFPCLHRKHNEGRYIALNKQQIYILHFPGVIDLATS